MTDREFLEKKAKELHLDELPIAAYVVDKDGRFVACNIWARELLSLPIDGWADRHIDEFYVEPKEHERLKKMAEDEERIGRTLVKLLTEFCVNGRTLFVHINCKVLRSVKRVVGYFYLIIDVTEEEQFRRFLPVGVYRLNADDTIAFMNEAAVEMFGFTKDDYQELVLNTRNVKEMYADEKRAEDTRRVVMEQGEFINNKVEFVKKNGEPFWASVSAYQLRDSAGMYAGREGILIDVTAEERYRRMLEDAPVATYEIRIDDSGQENIVHCNEEFAKLLGYESRNDVIGKADPASIPRTSEDSQRYHEVILKQDAIGEPVRDYHLLAKTRNGMPIDIAVYTNPIHKRPIKTESRSKIVGRVGVMLDITREVALKKQVEEFTYDFGQVLHTYSTGLLMIRLELDNAGYALAPDPFPGLEMPTPEQAYQVLIEPVRNLAKTFERFISAASKEKALHPISRDQWEMLSYQLSILKNTKQVVPEIIERPAVVGLAARKIFSALSNFNVQFFQADLIDVSKAASEVLRLQGLLALKKARREILELDPMVRSLRESVLLSAKQKQVWEVYSIGELIEQAMSKLSEYANSRGICYKRDFRQPNAKVRTIKDNVTRAISNLLHNAIKYSWAEPKSRDRFVTIGCKTYGNDVHVWIENFGVAIPNEEIEKNLLFRIGYRGRLSSDRDRPGTGIGLWDAQRVAFEHDGRISISSQPANPGGDSDNYNQPFITTATLKLPLYEESGE